MTFVRAGRLRTAGIVGLYLGLIWLVACGKRPNTVYGGAVTVKLALTAADTGKLPLGPGGSATLQATVYDQSNQGVTWSMTPLNFGTLSAQTSTNQSSNYTTVASVTYTAPANIGTNTTVTITATSISNPNISTSFPVTVTPGSVFLTVIYAGQLPAAAPPQTVGPGQQLLLSAILQPISISSQPVTFTLSPASAGSLTVITPQVVSYTAPTTVSSPLTATVTGTLASDPAATASLQINVLPSVPSVNGGPPPNVVTLNVNGGLVPTQIYPNGAFTSVTICPSNTEGTIAAGNPISSPVSCQTVGGILVDTGSYGLRILQSQIPLVKLTMLSDGNGNTLENCAPLVNGSYLWGPVAQVDVYMANEYTPQANIQAISSTDSVVPDGCANGGTNLNTPQLLGANGILGIGPEPTDCTLSGVNYCDGSTQTPPANVYYSCLNGICGTTDSPVIVPAGIPAQGGQQVINPLINLNNLSFGATGAVIDGNGVMLQLPAVSGTESSVIGTLTFGINTQPNNQLPATANVFTLDSNDNFTTQFNGQSLTNSFIDSGSNALYFPDSLPTCSVNTQYFCPPSLTGLSAQMVGANQVQNSVNFSVDNADNLLSSNPGTAAFSNLAGPKGTYNSCSDGNISCVFDWGLPFFYGQTVFSAIDGNTVVNAPATPPWFAY